MTCYELSLINIHPAGTRPLVSCPTRSWRLIYSLQQLKEKPLSSTLLSCTKRFHWDSQTETLMSSKSVYEIAIEQYIPLTNRVWGPYRKLRTEFYALQIVAKARSARVRGPKIVGEKRGSVTYSTDREDEVSKIFIVSLLCVWRVRKRFPFMRNGFKFRNQVESKTSQFEIVF